jgi:hypothetical protein
MKTLCVGTGLIACPRTSRPRLRTLPSVGVQGLPCKRRTCSRYPRLWAYDWRLVLRENLIAYGGRATMYTLSPPGADRLPWDRSKCGHGEGVACGGKRGCVIDAKARQSWSESFQRRLSRLYESAQAATKRDIGSRANVLVIGKEAQRAGPGMLTSWSSARPVSSSALQARSGGTLNGFQMSADTSSGT